MYHLPHLSAISAGTMLSRPAARYLQLWMVYIGKLVYINGEQIIDKMEVQLGQSSRNGMGDFFSANHGANDTRGQSQIDDTDEQDDKKKRPRVVPSKKTAELTMVIDPKL